VANPNEACSSDMISMNRGTVLDMIDHHWVCTNLLLDFI
jgi:hypothetical protein